MSRLPYYRDPTAKLFPFRWIFLLHLVVGPSGRWTYDTTLANPDISLNNFAEIHRNKINFYNTDFKVILMWTRGSFQPFNGEMKTPDNNCSVVNCHFTFDKKFFGENTTGFHGFHAIAFIEKNVKKLTVKDLPPRWPHQKYIFFGMESAANYPIENDIFDDFFNWTATYKLNSDILYSYFLIKDINGTIVGPKQDMNWVENMDDVDQELVKKFQNKTKAAAWFVSNCKTSSKREKFVSKLQNALNILNLSLDIYGDCGPLKCPLDDEGSCNVMLEREYYFYMALENSFSEDYVTEKVLRAMTHYTVPIVFGGANYSRFLPPGSYLNALDYINSPIQLAVRMYCLMHSPESYQRFFKWTNHYTYHNAKEYHVCRVCEDLNDDSKFENHSAYLDMKKWWNEKNYEPPKESKESRQRIERKETKKRSKVTKKKKKILTKNMNRNPKSKMQDVNKDKNLN